MCSTSCHCEKIEYFDSQVAILLQVGGANALAERFEDYNPHVGYSWVYNGSLAPSSRSNNQKGKFNPKQDWQMRSAFITVFPKVDVVVLQRVLSNMSVLCEEDVIRAITGKNQTAQRLASNLLAKRCSTGIGAASLIEFLQTKSNRPNSCNELVARLNALSDKVKKMPPSEMMQLLSKLTT